VDDSAVTREVLAALLNSDAEIRVIGQASTGAEAV
jgi:chemotaxis response regulator CheB